MVGCGIGMIFEHEFERGELLGDDSLDIRLDVGAWECVIGSGWKYSSESHHMTSRIGSCGGSVFFSVGRC